MKKEKSEIPFSDPIVDLYLALLEEIWESVSAMIGETILSLLFGLAIRRTGERYPFLNSLKVSEEGLFLEEGRKGFRNVSGVELHRGFQSLVNDLSNLFTLLTEGVIAKELLPKILPRIREAERMVFKK